MTHELCRWWLHFVDSWRVVMVGEGVDRPPAISAIGTILAVVAMCLPPRREPRRGEAARAARSYPSSQLVFDACLALACVGLALVHQLLDPSLTL